MRVTEVIGVPRALDFPEPALRYSLHHLSAGSFLSMDAVLIFVYNKFSRLSPLNLIQLVYTPSVLIQ